MVTTTTDKRLNKWYGWIPDIPDRRDRYLIAKIPKELPPVVDLRDKCPKEIYDQGNLGSCTANAIGCALQFEMIKQGEEDFTPSRLFIYFSERDVEGSIGEDAGAMIRDGIKCVNNLGAPHETAWPYLVEKFTQKPPQEAYDDALLHQALSYERVIQDKDQMKAVLASGYPIVIGFSVYQSFESQEVAVTGIVPMPGINEQLLGGHAVLVVGYDEEKQWFIVRNSWGSDWGDKGYFYMPYEFLLDENLADDFWCIKLIE